MTQISYGTKIQDYFGGMLDFSQSLRVREHTYKSGILINTFMRVRRVGQK